MNKRESELEALYQEMDSAFGDAGLPAAFTGAVTQEEFESWHGPDKFHSLSQDFYNSEPEYFRYFVPFAMKAYLRNYGKDLEADIGLNLFLLSLGEVDYKVDLIKQRYLAMHDALSESQRKCICSFLSFLRTNEMDDGHVSEGTIRYWCK